MPSFGQNQKKVGPPHGRGERGSANVESLEIKKWQPKYNIQGLATSLEDILAKVR